MIDSTLPEILALFSDTQLSTCSSFTLLQSILLYLLYILPHSMLCANCDPPHHGPCHKIHTLKTNTQHLRM